MPKPDLYSVTIRIKEDLLGTVPVNRDVYTQHIQTKAREQMIADGARGRPLATGEEATPDNIEEKLEEEAPCVPDLPTDEGRGWTTFMRDDQGPFLMSYILKGFLCESARTLKEWGNLKQLQDKFKRYVFIKERRVYLPEVSGQLERPLRAATPQGPRVTVVRSDVIAAGAELNFTVAILPGGGVTPGLLAEVLDYGQWMGLGQWRTGGWGAFDVVKLTLLEEGTPKAARAQPEPSTNGEDEEDEEETKPSPRQRAKSTAAQAKRARYG